MHTSVPVQPAVAPHALRARDRAFFMAACGARSRQLNGNTLGFSRVLDLWEASVRATHTFVSEADIHFFRPLARDVLPQIAQLVCVRDELGQFTGSFRSGKH
jgi:hypothetical protein